MKSDIIIQTLQQGIKELGSTTIELNIAGICKILLQKIQDATKLTSSDVGGRYAALLSITGECFKLLRLIDVYITQSAENKVPILDELMRIIGKEMAELEKKLDIQLAGTQRRQLYQRWQNLHGALFTVEFCLPSSDLIKDGVLQPIRYELSLLEAKLVKILVA